MTVQNIKNTTQLNSIPEAIEDYKKWENYYCCR